MSQPPSSRRTAVFRRRNGLIVLGLMALLGLLGVCLAPKADPVVGVWRETGFLSILHFRADGSFRWQTPSSETGGTWRRFPAEPIYSAGQGSMISYYAESDPSRPAHGALVDLPPQCAAYLVSSALLVEGDHLKNLEMILLLDADGSTLRFPEGTNSYQRLNWIAATAWRIEAWFR